MAHLDFPPFRRGLLAGRVWRGVGRAGAEVLGVLAGGLLVWGWAALVGALPHARVQLGVVVAAAVLLFPWQRRHPVAVLAVLAVLTGPVTGVGPLTAVAAYRVARRTTSVRRRAQLLGAAGAVVVAGATAAASWTGPGTLLHGCALGCVMAATGVVAPGLVGTARGQQERLVIAWRERGQAAERARLAADSEARTRERSRIAAEMHDLVGHRLSLISLHAGGLELAAGKLDPELRDHAVLVRRATRDAMRELQQALGILGPAERSGGRHTLTDATGTRGDIETLVERSADGGVAVRLEWAGADLDTAAAAVRRAVHRVVREALTNAHRYAPGADVTVAVAHEEDAVRVEVRNGAPTGPGGPISPSVGTGRGLTALRERVEVLGGVFEAGSLPSGGFRVTAVVPAGGREGVSAPRADPPAAPGAAGASGATASGSPLAQGLMAFLAWAVLVALMALGTAYVHGSAPHEPFPAGSYEPRLGMTYRQVAEFGVTDDAIVRAAATGHEPPRPARAAGCVYPRYGDGTRRSGGVKLARYCFDSREHLIAIDRFTVPAVRESATWEKP
ncbi:sensor histidine kinase [Streptomyces sp. NPDC058657]|uniref:sensor histidine kinase n=1 Tax=unclassified Streptomyces TaxID=2593676 RepID=UPI003651FCF7